MDLFHGTRATAIARDPGRARFLSAALTDGDGADAASLMVSLIDETFVVTPAARDAFSTATVRHFADDLRLPLALDRVDLVQGDLPRIEVVGTLKAQDQVRRVLVAGMQGHGRHAVIVFSAPSDRFEALLPAVRSSLASFRPDGGGGGAWSRSVAGAIAASAALALFLSWSVWRRRRRLRRAELGLPG